MGAYRRDRRSRRVPRTGRAVVLADADATGGYVGSTGGRGYGCGGNMRCVEEDRVILTVVGRMA